MIRRTRFALPLLLLAATMVPMTGHADDTDDPCHLMDDAPAYVCAGGGVYRTAMTFIRTRGMTVGIFAFEVAGPWGPTTQIQRSGVCLAVFKNRAFTEACGLPFDVSIDPLLETATIKGAVRNKRFGAVAMDLTFSPLEETGSKPGSGTGVIAGCGDLEAGSGAGSLYRPAESNGTLSIGKSSWRPRGQTAHLWQHVDAGSETVLSLPCAPERVRDGFSFATGCYTAFLPPVAAAASCNSSNLERRIDVVGRSKKATVRLTAVEMTDAFPSIPDPSWVDPMHTIPHPHSGVCISVATKSAHNFTCDGDFEIEMDPLLRTATIKGSTYSWGDQYGPPLPWMPRGLDHGRISVDLTTAVDDQGMQPSGRTRVLNFIECDGPVTVQATTLLRGDGGAVGTISFARLFGTFRGTQAKPLPAAMDTTHLSLSAAYTYPDACAEQEHEDD